VDIWQIITKPFRIDYKAEGNVYCSVYEPPLVNIGISYDDQSQGNAMVL